MELWLWSRDMDFYDIVTQSQTSFEEQHWCAEYKRGKKRRGKWRNQSPGRRINRSTRRTIWMQNSERYCSRNLTRFVHGNSVPRVMKIKVFTLFWASTDKVGGTGKLSGLSSLVHAPWTCLQREKGLYKVMTPQCNRWWYQLYAHLHLYWYSSYLTKMGFLYRH